MAQLAVFDDISALVDGDFLIAIATILLGALVMERATGVLRTRLYDIETRGGDALYSVITAVLIVLIPTPEQYRVHKMNVALGCLLGGGRVAVAEFGGI
ncbi:hypothetical protein [Haladaptatus cibarius]|uniref:hypothetical protein n=1 Tax=Haladaptatus cibarius TaxID=453847 RepID=UPI0006786F9A|nr:hypothetical protein [Haladaptatus cibarius]